MDRETFETRRKLGYTDDPATIVDPAVVPWSGRTFSRILAACLVLSVISAVLVSGAPRKWAIAAAVGSVLCFMMVFIYRLCQYVRWFYKAHREPTDRFLTEMAIGIAVGYAEKKLRERRRRDR